MKYAEWLEDVEPKRTPKGARLDLQLYVYPDGHGNILVKPHSNGGQPVGSAEEAMGVLRDLWAKACQLHGTAGKELPSELDALLTQVPDDFEPDEVDFGGPVGREIW